MLPGFGLPDFLSSIATSSGVLGGRGGSYAAHGMRGSPPRLSGGETAGWGRRRWPWLGLPSNERKATMFFLFFFPSRDGLLVLLSLTRGDQLTWQGRDGV